MTGQKLASLTVMALLAAGAAQPAAAYDGEGGETARVERNWKNSGGAGTRARRSDDNAVLEDEASGHSRGTARGNGGRGGNASSGGTRDQDVSVYEDREDRRGGTGAARDRDDDSQRAAARGYGRRGYHDDGIDPREAARIARAHRETPGHVVLRRDRYDEYRYDMPSYRVPRHRRSWWWWGW